MTWEWAFVIGCVLFSARDAWRFAVKFTLAQDMRDHSQVLASVAQIEADVTELRTAVNSAVTGQADARKLHDETRKTLSEIHLMKGMRGARL